MAGRRADEAEKGNGIDNQKGRRNVAEIDRIALAAKRSDIVARKAKAKQISTLKQGNSVPAKLPKREPIDTRRESAKAAGVGERTYDAGKRILEAVKAGKVAGTPAMLQSHAVQRCLPTRAFVQQ